MTGIIADVIRSQDGEGIIENFVALFVSQYLRFTTNKTLIAKSHINNRPTKIDDGRNILVGGLRIDFVYLFTTAEHKSKS